MLFLLSGHVHQMFIPFRVWDGTPFTNIQMHYHVALHSPKRPMATTFAAPEEDIQHIVKARLSQFVIPDNIVPSVDTN